MDFFLLLNVVYITQQHSWAQDQIEFFFCVTKDINAIAFNSSGVNLVHLLCTWISKYSLLPDKIKNTHIKS